jgi:hypothetical protein
MTAELTLKPKLRFMTHQSDWSDKLEEVLADDDSTQLLIQSFIRLRDMHSTVYNHFQWDELEARINNVLREIELLKEKIRDQKENGKATE